VSFLSSIRLGPRAHPLIGPPTWRAAAAPSGTCSDLLGCPCDACPYRARFGTRAEAEQDAIQHIHFRVPHRTRANEEER
jgi:hypothetical protein